MGLINARRILAPTDFSPRSDAALSVAIDLAKATSAKLELAHVYQIPGYNFAFVDTMVVASPETLALLQEKIRDELEKRAATVRAAGLECDQVVLEGSPWMEIVRRATETGPDLIVIGTHGRTGLGHLLVGSVAERVVQHAPCPILVVPHHPEP